MSDPLPLVREMRVLSRAYPDVDRAWDVYSELGRRLERVRDADGYGCSGYCARDEETGEGSVSVVCPRALVVAVSRVWRDLGGRPIRLPDDVQRGMIARHNLIAVLPPQDLAAGRSVFRYRGAELGRDGLMRKR